MISLGLSFCICMGICMGKWMNFFFFIISNDPELYSAATPHVYKRESARE